MLYALLCQDKPGQTQLRADTRAEHLAYLEGIGERLKLAGPFLGPDGKPNGSLVILEADDLAEAKAVAAADPYAKADLFESVAIRPWVWAVKNPEPEA